MNEWEEGVEGGCREFIHHLILLLVLFTIVTYMRISKNERYLENSRLHKRGVRMCDRKLLKSMIYSLFGQREWVKERERLYVFHIRFSIRHLPYFLVDFCHALQTICSDLFSKCLISTQWINEWMFALFYVMLRWAWPNLMVVVMAQIHINYFSVLLTVQIYVLLYVLIQLFLVFFFICKFSRDKVVLLWFFLHKWMVTNPLFAVQFSIYCSDK